MPQHLPASDHPVAVGYARDSSHRVEVQGYALAEGYSLAHIVDDQRDAATISQLTQHAEHERAEVVILPGDAILSAARARLEKELASLGATCVVLGAPSAPARGTFERVMPRRDFDAATRGKHSTEGVGRHQSSGTTDDI